MPYIIEKIFNKDILRTKLVNRNIPDYMIEPVVAYIFDGEPLGGFLTALFSNNLTETYLCADIHNLSHIKDWAAVLYHDIPMGCWGSKQHINNWTGLKL